MILNTIDIVKDSSLTFYFDPAIASSKFNGSYLYDLSGYGNDGVTADGSPEISDEFGGVLRMDGLTDQLKVTVNLIDNTNSNWSACTFVKYTASSNQHGRAIQQYINVGPLSSGAGTAIGEQSGTHNIWKSGGVEILDSGVSVNIDQWYYVAYTFDGTTNKIFVDGELANTSTVSPDNTTTTTLLLSGWRTPTSTMTSYKENFYGDQGPVLIYNRTLSDEEILQNFNVFRGRYGI